MLQDNSWQVTVDKTSYAVGDTLTFKSSYTKLRDATGEATRYIECDNNGVLTRYPFSVAIGDRKPGTTATGGSGVIPVVRPVPTKCRFVISVKYEIYFVRHLTETNYSEFFNVK